MSFDPKMIKKFEELHKDKKNARFIEHLEELRKDIERAERDSDLEGRVTNKTDTILEYYRVEILDQIESFLRGPKDTSDESIFEWISQNYIVAKLLTSTDFMKSVEVKELIDAKDALNDAIELANFCFANFGGETNYWGCDNAEKYKLDEEIYRKTQEKNLNSLREKLANFAKKQSYPNDPFRNLKYRIERRIKKNKGNYEFKSSRKAAAKANFETVKSYSTFDTFQVQKYYPEGNYYETDKDELNKILSELIGAKTTYNSGEYNNIISTVEKMNKKKDGPWDVYLTDKENHKAKLLNIKKYINKYIQHKASDGVKKNTYHKLAAVEKLNKFVTERIKSLGRTKFTDPSLKDLNDTLDTVYQTPDNQMYRVGLEDNVDTANKLYGAKTTVDECNNTLDCMDRIIEKAKSKDALKKMQKEFLDSPGTPHLTSSLTLEDINKSITKANAKLTINEDDEAYLEVSFSRDKENFDDSKIIYIFGREFDSNVEFHDFKSNKEVTFGTNKLSKMMIDIAKKADKMVAVDNARNDAEEGKSYHNNHASLDRAVGISMNAIERGARNHLSDVIKNFKENIKSDKDLVDQWPEVNLALKYSKKTLGKEDPSRLFLERYEDRMTQVVKEARTRNLEKNASKAPTLG